MVDLAGASLDAIGAALAEVPGFLNLNHDSHRIAVTGLQRSGKTVFVTSFVHALLQAADAPVADFPFFPWRGQVQGVSVEDIPGIPPFPYRGAPRRAAGRPADVAGAARPGLRGMRVRIRYTPTGGLTAHGVFSTATIDLDLIDYPGEWLLDLPMLTQSYQEWSARMEELANSGQPVRPVPGVAGGGAGARSRGDGRPRRPAAHRQLLSRLPLALPVRAAPLLRAARTLPRR